MRILDWARIDDWLISWIEQMDENIIKRDTYVVYVGATAASVLTTFTLLSDPTVDDFIEQVLNIAIFATTLVLIGFGLAVAVLLLRFRLPQFTAMAAAMLVNGWVMLILILNYPL